MENEIWKPVVGFEGKYQVSNFGNVRSLRFRNQNFPKDLTQKTNNKGYKVVDLTDKGKNKPALVHRLVAMAFIDNPNNFPIVNHKDENPQNNHADNLEWCTYSYNTIYSMNIHPERKRINADNLEKYSPRNKKGIPHKHYKQVAILDDDNNIIKVYDNAVTAASILGLHTCNVTEVCKANKKRQIGKKRRTGGYIFEFLEE
jgi:hypothetical protein